MSKTLNDTLRGQTTLITGASSGLGRDFARELGARGADLILVARRREPMEALATELERDHGVTVTVMPSDLARPEAPAALHRAVADAGLQVDILVNNAGFGLHGPALELDWTRERDMLELDMLSVVQLSKLFGRDMVARGRGRILQVSSIGAYQASPSYASYSAAKRFVLDYGEALHHELRGTGVSCTVVSPGVTATEFLTVAGQRPTLYQRLVMMRSAEVAGQGIKALLRGRRSVVTGRLNALTAAFARLSPRCLSTALAARMMRAG